MNNFDISSTGENIEIVCEYDNDLSQDYFNDFLDENTRLNFGHNDYIYLIGDSSKPFYGISELRKMVKSELIKLADNYELFGYDNAVNYSKDDIIYELSNVKIKYHYEYLISQYSWHEIQNHFTHSHYISRGYSQGDATIVVNLDEAFTPAMRQWIDNLFWDAPVYLKITVNDDEFEGYELMSHIYQYDVDEIKLAISKLDISDNAKNWISENLPACPEWS